MSRAWLAAIACVFPMCANAGPPDALPFAQELQDVLDNGLRTTSGTGVAAAVVVAGKGEWVGVSGMSDPTAAAAVEPDMLFDIASVGKVFVATIVLQLAEEGKLTLDDRLTRWLPAFPNVDSTITIRQLLNHTSGVYQFFSNPLLWKQLGKDRARRWTAPEVLAYLEAPYFKPGGGFRYSNSNYTLLGMIIEKATGSRISTLLRRRFWQPLGLSSPFDFVEEESSGPLAHVWGTLDERGAERDLTSEPRLAHESIVHPSGGIFMTAVDLARWSDALFRGRVVKAGSLEEMKRFGPVPRGQLPDTQGYGLGLQSYQGSFVAGQKAWGHSGGSIGTIAYMLYLPDREASIAVMINSYNGKCISRTVSELVRVLSRRFPPANRSAGTDQK
jgi:D-alanyl-D-alanine carboxypeptidase